MVDFAAGKIVQSFEGWLRSKERSDRPIVRRMVAKQGAIVRSSGRSKVSCENRSFVRSVVRSNGGCCSGKDRPMVDFAEGSDRKAMVAEVKFEAARTVRSLSKRSLVQRSFVRPVVRRMVAKHGAIAKQWLQRCILVVRRSDRKAMVAAVDFEAARTVRSLSNRSLVQ